MLCYKKCGIYQKAEVSEFSLVIKIRIYYLQNVTEFFR